MLGAGKGTVADYLVGKGFKHYSARDFFTKEVLRRGLVVNRDSLVLIANDLRAKYGPGYPAEQLYEMAVRGGGDAVIESLRCLGEVDVLRKKALVGHGPGGPGDFVLFGVDADPETRYARIIERGSATDKISFDEFVAHEQREAAQEDPTKGNIRGCIDVADHVFRNDWTIEELNKKIEAVLMQISGEKEVEKSHKRPSWDEYFMKMATLVAERSTCLRHNIGSVIVKNKRVLATGYNGSARGAPNCIEVGCLKDQQGIESGKWHNICRAVHAQMNAIIQGALHGVSVDGTIMYCTHTPCTLCARMIVNAGIKEVVSYHDYSDEGARKFLADSGVLLRKVDRPDGKIRFND